MAAKKQAAKSVPAVVNSGSTAVAISGDWEKDLAAAAQMSAKVGEAVSGAGNWVTFRAGVMAYKGLPLKNSQLEAVVLDEVLENLYYEGKFDPNTPASPVCYALSRDVAGLVPHGTAPQPQHDSCKGCPQNEFGSADNKKGKACKNIVRLALIAYGDGSKEQIETCELAFAKIPVTSVRNWASYTKALREKYGRGAFGFVTKITAQPDPKNQIAVEFDFVAAIDKKLGPSILKRVQEARGEIIPELPYQQIEREERPAKRGGKSKF